VRNFFESEKGFQYLKLGLQDDPEELLSDHYDKVFDFIGILC
jgi:hypothetical protein